MNWDLVHGDWKELRHKVLMHWDQLTEDDVKWIGGDRERWVRRLEERTGRDPAALEEEVERFVRRA
ncbi:MAG: CsbD family protein [Myxococcota bacterium]